MGSQASHGETVASDFTYFYSKLTAQVFVTETRGGRFQVNIANPNGGRDYASKVFKRGADPSPWIGKQLGKILPKLVAEVHRWHNDDHLKDISEVDCRPERWPDRRSLDSYGYDDPYYW